jgi:Holliday junction DNA helicase RuvA
LIAHLTGKILFKEAPVIVLEAAGVGYEVTVTVPTYSGLPEPGGEASLFVHTHVREDLLALFGFASREEKRLFERLLAVSGIGPKLAVTILSGIAAPQLVAAIKAGDTAKLTKTPGVGKKTAERMVLELRDKLTDFLSAPHEAAPKLPVGDDVLSALVNLGYPRPAAEKATEAAMKEHASDQKFDVVFRAALGRLTR